MISNEVKILETESRSKRWLPRAEGRAGGNPAYPQFQAWEMKKLQSSVAPQREYTQHHYTVHLKMTKMVNLMLCIFY